MPDKAITSVQDAIEGWLGTASDNGMCGSACKKDPVMGVIGV
jgi:hypothetical protein